MTKRTTFNLPAEAVTKLKKLSEVLEFTQDIIITIGISFLEKNMNEVPPASIKGATETVKHSIVLQQSTIAKLDFLKKKYSYNRTAIMTLVISAAYLVGKLMVDKMNEDTRTIKKEAEDIYNRLCELEKLVLKLNPDASEYEEPYDGIMMSRAHLDNALGGMNLLNLDIEEE